MKQSPPMAIRSIMDVVDVQGKRCLVRVDFNVPMKGKKVLDEFRIRQSLPTIKHIIKHGGTVILISHLGRPDGRRVQALSLRPIVALLKKLLPKVAIAFQTAPVSMKLVSTVKRSKAQVIVLENIRFDKREELHDRSLAQQLAEMADLYVNDAFSVCHRRGASITGVPAWLPAYGGHQLMQEVAALDRVITPQQPAVAVIGGLKADSKFGVIKTLSEKFTVLVGGGIANLFLHARGFDVGGSAFDETYVRQARALTSKKIHVPVDAIVTNKEQKTANHRRISKRTSIAATTEGLVDIGPETIKKFAAVIRTAKTIVWAGPLGVIEDSRFSHGSLALGKLIASRASGKAFVVVGGGETNEILHRTHMIRYIDFVSTAGGAMLEYLAGKTLPGINALEK